MLKVFIFLGALEMLVKPDFEVEKYCFTALWSSVLSGSADCGTNRLLTVAILTKVVFAV